MCYKIVVFVGESGKLVSSQSMASSFGLSDNREKSEAKESIC